MFDSTSAIRWLEILSSIGEEKMLHLLQTADPQLIITAMNRFITVRTRNPEVDLVEQRDTLPPFTLDDIFFIDFRIRESENVVKNFLATIINWNTGYYFGLMEELATGLHLETEELAGKWRRSRLADKGFPEFDEALEIYQFVPRKTVSTAREREEGGTADAFDLSGTKLWYPMKLMPDDTLFKRSLNGIAADEENDRLSTELAHLANKVIVADGRDPGSVDELHASLRKVGGYINIALEEFCGDNEFIGAEVLKDNHMEILFRRGFSLILDLRKEAQKTLRDYEGGVENVGYPLAELLNGLLQKRPYYAGKVVGEDKSRDFQTLDDIRNIRTLLKEKITEEAWEPI